MTYLPRNKVVSVPLYWLKDFYHHYQQRVILRQSVPVESLSLPASFQEDLTAVVNYFNGLLSEGGLEEYANVTPYPDDIPYDERLEFLYQLYHELEQITIRVLQLPQPLYTHKTQIPHEIKLGFESDFLFIYDGRKDVYIPTNLVPFTRSSVSPDTVG